MRILLSITRRVGMQRLLMIKLFAVLLLMGTTRWVFYLFNTDTFSQLHFFELLRLMFVGLRFDLSALAIINLPVILMLTVPFVFRFHPIYQRITNILFVVLNSLALALNMIDVIYFRYISKRTTSELFQFFGNKDENVFLLVGRFFIDFWYILLMFLLLVWALVFISKFIVLKSPATIRQTRWYVVQSLICVLWLGISVIMIRGGFQLKPISLVSAARYTSPQHMALVLNTPFTVIKTYNTKAIKPVSYFEHDALVKVFNPVYAGFPVTAGDSLGQDKKNVVILILESFGREHIGFYQASTENSNTPFLDSLLAESISFRAWANGKRSIEAVPSILASLPSLMNIDYLTSHYVSNNITGLGTILQEMGYSTAFFHGGSNGTMSFDAFARVAGFEHYFGRDEYSNEADFDGQWGIFDEPFLQYTAAQINAMPEPFGVGLFTLSSHHPYTVPPQYNQAFPNAHNKIQKSIAYTDLALRRFFETMKHEPWFNHTIFVITADHTSEDDKIGGMNSALGNFAVPLAFYQPDQQAGARIDGLAQQTDILPTLLAMLHYDKPFVAFGNNLIGTTKPAYSVSFLNGIYQLLMDGYLIQFNGSQTIGLYQMEKDPMLLNNLADTEPEVKHRLESFLKAVIQQYNNRMINNALTLIE